MNIIDQKKKIPKKLRFIIVGTINTIVDFSVFMAVSQLTNWPLFVNYISTTIALTFSFFANKYVTFEDQKRNNPLQITKFLAVTLIGLWILQPIIISMSLFFLQDTFESNDIGLFISKGFATIFTLIWNYYLYNKFVFTK